MMSASTVLALAERLIKAHRLVDAGAVLPVVGQDGYWTVQSGNGRGVYLVRFEDGRERCSCQDFRQRQAATGLPCKHLLAVDLALRNEADLPTVNTSDLRDRAELEVLQRVEAALAGLTECVA